MLLIDAQGFLHQSQCLLRIALRQCLCQSLVRDIIGVPVLRPWRILSLARAASASSRQCAAVCESDPCCCWLHATIRMPKMNMYNDLVSTVINYSWFLGCKDTTIFLKLYRLPMENLQPKEIQKLLQINELWKTVHCPLWKISREGMEKSSQQAWFSSICVENDAVISCDPNKCSLLGIKCHLCLAINSQAGNNCWH